MLHPADGVQLQVEASVHLELYSVLKPGLQTSLVSVQTALVIVTPDGTGHMYLLVGPPAFPNCESR